MTIIILKIISYILNPFLLISTINKKKAEKKLAIEAKKQLKKFNTPDILPSGWGNYWGDKIGNSLKRLNQEMYELSTIQAEAFQELDNLETSTSELREVTEELNKFNESR